MDRVLELCQTYAGPGGRNVRLDENSRRRINEGAAAIASQGLRGSHLEGRGLLYFHVHFHCALGSRTYEPLTDMIESNPSIF